MKSKARHHDIIYQTTIKHLNEHMLRRQIYNFNLSVYNTHINLA